MQPGLKLVTALGLVILGCGSTTADRSSKDASVPGDAAADTAVGPDAGKDAAPDTAPPPDYCPPPNIPSANAWIESPQRKETLTVSLFGEVGGECGSGLHVLLAEDAQKMKTATVPGSPEREVISLYTEIGFELKPGGQGPITVIDDRTGELASGTMTINDVVLPDIPGAPSNTPRLSISFTVTQPGWSGGGSAEATYCIKADIFCP